MPATPATGTAPPAEPDETFETSSESAIEEIPGVESTKPSGTDGSGTVGTDDRNEGYQSSDSSSIATKTGERRCYRRSRAAWSFYLENQFPIHIVVGIALARAYPPLGAVYLAPQITATWIAVATIFLLSGLGLRTEQLSNAFRQIYFTCTVQIFNFFVVSAVTFGASRVLLTTNILNEALANGLVICGSLPVSINAIILLSAAAGGDEAAAVCNATFGNVVGIFLSPILILGYLGKTGDVSLGDVFLSLVLRVIVPLVVGQVLQKTSERVRSLCVTYKKMLTKAQEWCLVYIVYTVFCRTFMGDSRAGIGDAMIVIVSVFVLMNALSLMAWVMLSFLYADQPELRVTGLFTCVQKTLALGAPLIASMYPDDPNIALYTLPILIWHPMHLVIGSMMVPRLSRFIKNERFRLDNQDKEEQELNTERLENGEAVDVDIEEPRTQS